MLKQLIQWVFNPDWLTFKLDTGGGGGSKTPAQQTVTTTSIPDYAKPYVESMLGQAWATANQGYTPYGYDRIAGFSPLQQQVQEQVGSYQLPGQTAQATQMAQDAASRAAQLGQYQAGTFGNQFRAPTSYQAGQFNAPMAQAAQLGVAPTGQAALSNYDTSGNLQRYQMAGPERVSAQSFLQPGTAQSYMSPYMQQVVDTQSREAIRQSDIMRQQQNAQAAQAGAFGGSRQAIIEAERMRNLGTQLNDIQATGSQAAFQNAQQQFNAEQQARLQANLANQAAGLTAGGQNLSALLGVQQLGYQGGLQQSLANQAALNQMGLANLNMAGQYGLQQGQFGQAANLANQQAIMNMMQLGEQSRQFGYGQDMTAAQLGAQYGLAGQQLGEQSRQFGANLGLQGLQQQLAAAGLMGNLGQQQYAQDMGLMGLQNQIGAQQQALQQQYLTQDYQDFLNQRGYTQQQLGWFSDMLRGLPLAQQTQAMYQAPPSAAAQLAGAGMTMYGMSRLPYAKGGLTSIVANKLMQG